MNYKNIHKIILTLLVVLIVALTLRLTKVWKFSGGNAQPNPTIPDDSNSHGVTLSPYRETKSFAIPLERPVAMSIMPDGVLLAGGDELVMLGKNGEVFFTNKMPGTISCFTTDEEGTLYVCIENQVLFCNSQGNIQESFSLPGEEHLITGIVVSDGCIYLADALNKQVLCFDTNGELLNAIGESQPDRDFSGFIVPSPYFDINLDHFGNLWATNPGRHELNHFDGKGRLVSTWGKASYSLDGFCGCCNPTCFLILPNGSFVTAEKGIPRVKIYNPDGSLNCLIAGPEAFDEGTVGLDLGVTEEGEIVIMDPKRKELRYFERRASSDE
jgi:hypothetical protein